jgi:membrane protein implicated in regulation of membrane protease activity
MRYVVGFIRFWYEFIVGDDWLVAAGVVVALGVTWVLSHNDVPAWWLMPVAVLALLLTSLWRATRESARPTPGAGR